MWGAIIQLIAGLGVAGYNAYKAGKAKKDLKNLGDVDYTTPKGYADNVGVTANELAQGGIDAETMNTILGQLQQQFAGGVTAVQQTGGGVNDVAKLYGAFNDNVAKVGLQSTALRNQKLENYLQATSTYAGQEALRWKLNQYDRNRNNKAAANAAILGFNQGTNSGINTAIQGGVNLGNYFDSNPLEYDWGDDSDDDTDTGTGNMYQNNYGANKGYNPNKGL